VLKLAFEKKTSTTLCSTLPGGRSSLIMQSSEPQDTNAKSAAHAQHDFFVADNAVAIRLTGRRNLGKPISVKHRHQFCEHRAGRGRSAQDLSQLDQYWNPLAYPVRLMTLEDIGALKPSPQPCQCRTQQVRQRPSVPWPALADVCSATREQASQDLPPLPDGPITQPADLDLGTVHHAGRQALKKSRCRHDGRSAVPRSMACLLSLMKAGQSDLLMFRLTLCRVSG
jgi:hypothetical protein